MDEKDMIPPKKEWGDKEWREYYEGSWFGRRVVDVTMLLPRKWVGQMVERFFEREKRREETKAERAKIAEMKEAGRQVRITRRENRKLFYLEQAERKREEKARKK